MTGKYDKSRFTVINNCISDKKAAMWNLFNTGLPKAEAEAENNNDKLREILCNHNISTSSSSDVPNSKFHSLFNSGLPKREKDVDSTASSSVPNSKFHSLFNSGLPKREKDVDSTASSSASTASSSVPTSKLDLPPPTSSTAAGKMEEVDGMFSSNFNMWKLFNSNLPERQDDVMSESDISENSYDSVENVEDMSEDIYCLPCTSAGGEAAVHTVQSSSADNDDWIDAPDVLNRAGSKSDIELARAALDPHVASYFITTFRCPCRIDCRDNVSVTQLINARMGLFGDQPSVTLRRERIYKHIYTAWERTTQGQFTFMMGNAGKCD
jgi:hypothetical protein